MLSQEASHTVIRRQVFRYAVVTPMVGTMDLGLYYALNLFLPFSAAKAVSYVLANALGYVFNKYWAFECREYFRAEAARYLTVKVLLFVWNVGINHGLRVVFPGWVMGAAVTASLTTALLSFLAKKRWVFRK